MRKSCVLLALALALGTAPAFAQGTPQTISSVDVRTIGTGFRASKIIGSTVVNDRNETIGKVDDLLVTQSGAAGGGNYVVLSVGGFLGVGSKLVAIRYDQLRPDPDKSEFILPGATKESLRSLPDYAYAR